LNQALIPIFLGNLDNRKAIALADFLSRFGEDTLRGTINQNILLRNIPDAYLGNLFVLANQISELASAPRFLASAVACTGASTCKLGICLPRGALSAAAKKLKSSGLDLDRIAGLKFNISGCPNTCGAHMAADLGFYGKVLRKGQTPYPAYGIVVGGKAGAGVAALAEPAGDVAARDLPGFVVDFLGHYIYRQSAYPDYSSYLEAEGKARISEWTQAHKEIPDFDDDKNYYYDWSAPEVFSLAGRGVGECSAGLFDLIESDLKRIRRFREELPGLAATDRAQALYQITLSAARMLLITRAVEPKSDADVFSQFHKYFLDTGLVEPKFTALIDLGQRADAPAISLRENEVLSLAQAVEALYEKMDNSLRFPQETAAPAQPRSPAPAAAEIPQRDFRGVACPMNFVKTKVALEPLKPGDRLAVLLDDGAPIQNVPRSVAGEGHKIVSQVREGQHWRVVIEKAG
jgi:sulfite reductase (ferredoxin)